MSCNNVPYFSRHWSRDTILAIDEVAKFEMVMETARKAIHDFINDEPDDVKVYEMEHPDVLLWAVWCIQQYAKMVSRDQCREKYGTLLQDIMEYLRRENHPNLFLHSNGLLYATSSIANVSPGREINISRARHLNHGYPARI